MAIAGAGGEGTDTGVAGAPAIDTSTAHPARVYDYWLGGKDNFAADREAAELALQAYPQLAEAVQSNRAFLARAVRYLTHEAGIRQFLDIGTGIPGGQQHASGRPARGTGVTDRLRRQRPDRAAARAGAAEEHAAGRV
jgi:S-adenosyl methyltransferase